MRGLLLVAILCLGTRALAQDLFIKNSCSFGLWAEGRASGNALIPGETNAIKYVAPGSSVSYTIPAAGLSSTRFWAKYGCDSRGANCIMGDQVANYNIYPGTGCPPGGCSAPVDSLFEATWGCKSGTGCSTTTWFDTSQVDGWTLPYRVTLTGNTQCDCTSSGCVNLRTIDASRLNLANCPTNEDLSNNNQYSQYNSQNLRIIKNGNVVGCKSPCKHMNLPPIQTGLGLNEGTSPTVYYCCPTPSTTNCNPSTGCLLPDACRAGPIERTKYVAAVHQGAPGVYAYSYDDLVGLHQCPASGVQYTMEYCPPGSAAYPYNPSSGTPTNPPSTPAPSQSSTAPAVNQGNIGVDIFGADLTSTTASSGLDCAQQCDRTSGCQAWSWAYPASGCGAANTCWLKGSSAGARSANPCRESGVRMGDVGADRVGNDLPGMPLNLPAGSTPASCATQCSLNSGCVAWTFDSCGTSCWLKSSDGPTTANSCRTSGVKGYVGRDYVGNDIGSSTLTGTASATTCAKLCASTAGCRAWSFVNPKSGCESTNTCWLKSAAGPATSNACRVSGTLSSSTPSTPSPATPATPPPSSSCGTYDTANYVCTSGHLCPKTAPNWCGNGCYSPSAYKCCNNALAPLSSTAC